MTQRKIEVRHTQKNLLIHPIVPRHPRTRLPVHPHLTLRLPRAEPHGAERLLVIRPRREFGEVVRFVVDVFAVDYDALAFRVIAEVQEHAGGEDDMEVDLESAGGEG